MKGLIFIFSFVIFLSGCAPQYAIRNQYIPPFDQKSKVCLRNCSYQKQKCHQRCKEDYSDCLSYANERARQIQIRIDREYKKRYERYLEKLSDYNLKISNWQDRYDERYRDWRYFDKKCSKNSDKYACERAYDLRYIIKRMQINRPVPPKEPRYVTFKENLASWQKVCSKSCGCDDDYNSCFITDLTHHT